MQERDGIIGRLRRLPQTLKGLGRIANPLAVTNSPQERAYKIDQVLSSNHYALRNHDIWAWMIKERGKLTDRERQKILEAYTWQKDELFGKDSSVAELMEVALGQRQRNYFLNRVAFNYDYALGAEERDQVAMQELNEGKRRLLSSDWDVWSLDKWVEMEFVDAEQMTGIRRFEDFDRQTLEKIQGYRPTYDSTYTWGRRSVYSKDFFRLLDRDQLIKAADTRRYFNIYGPPTVVYK
jgi:hypothetical protein